MEKLIHFQLAQKELLEKFVINYKKDGKDRRTQNYYAKRLKDFQILWDAAVDNHRDILIQKYASKDGKADKLEYFERDIFSDMESHFRDNYEAIESRFENEYPPEIRSKTKGDARVAITQVKGEEFIRLPKITLERFSGDYNKWITFFDLFRTMIHENKSISSVQKLQYLKMHLSGEAEQLLRHFQVTENNYESAWNLLIERYDNKRVLVNNHLKTLFGQNVQVNENAMGIKSLLDTTTECIQAIENLGLCTDKWDVLIVFIVVQKLPSETHSLWEQSLANHKDLPSWKMLQQFLIARFRTLEAIIENGHASTGKANKSPFTTNRNTSQTYHLSPIVGCPVCGNQHQIKQCSKFLAMDFNKKFETVKQKGLCLNCLGVGHIKAKCPSQYRCTYCKMLHHSLMHRNQSDQQSETRWQSTVVKPTQNIRREYFNKEPIISSVITQQKKDGSFQHTGTTLENNEFNIVQVDSFVSNNVPKSREILLATALVRVLSPTGNEYVLRALIDQGSQATFITEAAIQRLGLAKTRVRVSVSGVGQTEAGRVTAKVQLMIKPLINNDTIISTTGLVLKNITHTLPFKKIAMSHWEHIHGLELADPSFYKPGKIDLLLGADVYAKVIKDGLIRGKEGVPIAQHTIFGWILSGEIAANVSKPITINNFHLLPDLEGQLRKFWELEEVDEDKMLTEEERLCEEHFTKTHKRLADGKYEVALPFNTLKGEAGIGESRTAAITRLYQMEARFRRNANLKEEYGNCLEEYRTLEHMTEASAWNGQMGQTMEVCYLPHHAVIKEARTTTKLRVVFDASKQTTNGNSLNDVTLKGPTIQDGIACLLLRWRKHQIAFTADIEKMYRQIWVKPEDTDYQRIVWRTNSDNPIKDYKLLTVTFGTKSAPYLATRTLKQIAIDEKERYPIGAESVMTEFYVDDFLSGADTLETALERQDQVLNLLKSGGFNLRKWVSNNRKILERVSENTQELTTPFKLDESEQVKALGLCWNPKRDILCYSIEFEESYDKWTKRKVLSEVAKLFDPLGWAAPCIIIAKLFIQKLWLSKLDWDDGLTNDLEKEWIGFRKKLPAISTITLPRWIHYNEHNSGVEIHGFSDASLLAYAAVIYVCITDGTGNRHSTLLAAKTKVSPIKTVSLPRLELCGAVLLAKLTRYVSKSIKIPNVTLHAWTDSEIVLAWLKSHPSKWKTFIANRVAHIHELIGEAVWRHVSSKDNPADCATRGLTPSDLRINKLWWKGPEWLEKTKAKWPCKNDILDTTLETRRVPNVCMQAIVEEFETRYSSLTQLLRITAYCYRFKTKEKGYIKATETKAALVIWIRKTQQKHFFEEIKALSNEKSLKTSSRLIKLTPFLHVDGLLRVGGRLRYADLSFDEKHPIILPDKCHLTTLIIEKSHQDTLHGGPQLMMRVIAKQFWLLNARNSIRYHIHKCIPCFRQKAEVQSQLMGNLPRPRVTRSRPFSHVGVDYCGPFDIRRYRGRGSRTYKSYISVFICMATKAIHLELVTDLSAQGFIAAFRRFASRRGLPSDVYCDCGSNFIGAHKILTREVKQMIDGMNIDIASIIEREGVNFNFIPPASPHFGGLWESGVRSTKQHLKRILGNTTLTYEELSTVLTQIEACLNSRPLCAASNDSNDLTSLTPAHFLIGDIMLTPPEPSLLDLNLHRLDRWQYIQNLYQSFWKRWNDEYLCRLQQRPKWTQRQPNVQVGDLIILKEDNMPPSRWPLGRVTETHPGSDGLVRVVTIKTKEKILKRPIAKICLLPIENHDDQS